MKEIAIYKTSEVKWFGDYSKVIVFFYLLVRKYSFKSDKLKNSERGY